MFSALFFLAISGCKRQQEPCSSFEDIDITDPEHIAEDAVVQQIEEAIAQFQEWTGRDGVCVDEIRIVSEVTKRSSEGEVLSYPEISGTYLGELVQVQTTPHTFQTTIHELCHGLDLGLEHYSNTYPHLFASVSGAETYPNDPEDDAAEVYARSCDQGPLPLELALEWSCEELPRTSFVLDQTFSGRWESPYDWVDGLALSPRALPLTESEGTQVAAAGRGAVYLGREASRPDGFREISLFEIPIDSGDVVTFSGPLLGPEAKWSLLGGEGEEPLLVVIDETSRAWRISGGDLEQVPFPTDIRSLFSGVLADGAVWADVQLEEQTSSSPQRVDLNSGVLSSWPMPELVGGPDDWLSSSGYVATAWLGADGWWLALYDPARGAWTTVPAPQPFDLSGYIAALPDGRVLFRWLGDASEHTGFGWYTPATGQWTLAREPCDGERFRFAGHLLVVDGQPYWLQWPDDDSGASFSLVHIELP